MPPSDHVISELPKVAGASYEDAVRSTMVNASKLSLAMAITIPLGFVGRILIPRVLGSEHAGMLFFAESFSLLVLNFLPLGIPSYIQKTVSARHEHAKEIFVPILSLELILGLFLSLGLMCFMLMTDYEPQVIWLTGIMAVYQMFAIYTNEIAQPMFIAIGQINFTAILNVSAKLLLTLLILLCLLFKGGPAAFAWIFLVAQAVILGVVLMKAARLGMWEFSGLRNGLQMMWPVVWASLPFFAGQVITRISGSIDMAFLSRLGNYQEVGYYGAIQRLYGLFMMLVPVMQSALMPVLTRAYSSDREQYNKLAASSFRVLLILALPLSFGMTAFAHEAVALIYGAEYAPAAATLMINGPLLLVVYAVIFLATNVVITTDGKGMALILALGCVVNIVLDRLFIPMGLSMLGAGGGSAGALTGTLVVEVFVGGLLLLICRETKGVFNGRILYVFVAALAPALAVLAAQEAWFQLSLPLRIAMFVIGLPVYIVVSRLASIKELLHLTRNVLNRSLKMEML